MTTSENVLSSVSTTFQIFGIIVFVLAMGHILLGYALPEPPATDARAHSPVYRNFADKEEFWIEHKRAWRLQFEPYFHWRRRAFSGRHTNVDEHGTRLTLPKVDSTDAKRVFILGGSTVWGTGAEDAGTIPSHLQRTLGDGYQVMNFGESGYTSTQELNYLMFQLARGNVPDYVLFYDGVNDGYAGVYSPAIPRDPENLRANYTAREQHKRRSFFVRLALESNYGKWLQHVQQKHGKDRHAEWDAKVEPHIAKNAQGVLDMYEAHIRQANALAREYGFKVFFLWQPHLFSMSRPPQGDFEAKIIERSSSVLIESQRRLYELAKSQLSDREAERVHFLGDILNDVLEPIYIDWHHMASPGNAIIAHGIHRALQADLP